MKTKFTRGPLRAWGGHIFDSDGNHIGTVLNRNVVVQESNACLWAAAPEMYEMLEEIVNLPGFEPNEAYGQKVMSILKKARGE